MPPAPIAGLPALAEGQGSGGLRDRITIQTFVEDDSRAFPTKGQCARRHLVQHSAEGKQIATCIQFFRSHLRNWSRVTLVLYRRRALTRSVGRETERWARVR